MKLLQILQEQGTRTTLSDLKFGVNVKRGDSLADPKRDSLTQINDEGDLERWKQDKDLSLEVIIDRTQPWMHVFKIPAFKQERDKYKQGKKAWLGKQREKGNSGFD